MYLCRRHPQARLLTRRPSDARTAFSTDSLWRPRREMRCAESVGVLGLSTVHLATWFSKIGDDFRHRPQRLVPLAGAGSAFASHRLLFRGEMDSTRFRRFVNTLATICIELLLVPTNALN